MSEPGIFDPGLVLDAITSNEMLTWLTFKSGWLVSVVKVLEDDEAPLFRTSSDPLGGQCHSGEDAADVRGIGVFLGWSVGWSLL